MIELEEKILDIVRDLIQVMINGGTLTVGTNFDGVSAIDDEVYGALMSKEINIHWLMDNINLQIGIACGERTNH